MPWVMHLTLLVLLFLVKHCTGNTTASAAKETTVSVAQPTSLAVITKYDTTLSTVTTTTNTQKPSTAAHQITSGSSPAPPSTSSQRTSRTETEHPDPSPEPTVTYQTSSETFSHGPTPTNQPESETPSGSATTTTNTTSPDLSHSWGKDDFAANPGLVAVLCIFCIIAALLFVVVTLKCIKSPSSNFEKLEDMPMGAVNEKSPFAKY